MSAAHFHTNNVLSGPPDLKTISAELPKRVVLIKLVDVVFVFYCVVPGIGLTISYSLAESFKQIRYYLKIWCPSGFIPVSVKNDNLAQAFALQSSSGNCSPASDLVLRKLIFQTGFFSEAASFSKTPVRPVHKPRIWSFRDFTQSDS